MPPGKRRNVKNSTIHNDPSASIEDLEQMAKNAAGGAGDGTAMILLSISPAEKDMPWLDRPFDFGLDSSRKVLV